MMKLLKTIVQLLGLVFILLIGFVLFNHFSSIDQKTIDSEVLRLNELLDEKNAIVCTLEARNRVYRVGQPPDLKVRLINKLDSPILLVGSLDGSELGIRRPLSYFEVRHAQLGDLWHQSAYCINVNPNRVEDFKSVNSMDEFNPYASIDDYGYFSAQRLEGTNFYFPGIYEITYHYSTSKKLKDANLNPLFISNTNVQLDELWEQVPIIELMSNTVTIEYNL